MEIFRGDTLKFDFSADLEDGSTYEFQVGDILKVGAKEKLTNTRYKLYKKIEIGEPTKVVPITFSRDEMKKCSVGDMTLEIELTDTQGNVRTLYQEKLTIVGDVINE